MTKGGKPPLRLAARPVGRLRSGIVDPQRPYTADPAPWYNDHDDVSEPGGPRDPGGDRYSGGGRYGDDGRGAEPRYDDGRYDEGRYDDNRYDESRFGDEQRYRDAYVGSYSGDESRGNSAEHRFDVPDQRYDGDGRTRGRRSGIELPNDDDPRGGHLSADRYDESVRDDSSPRYRTEALDRGALRRPATEPGSASGESGPAVSPAVTSPGLASAIDPTVVAPATPMSGAPDSGSSASGSPLSAMPVSGSPIPPSSTVYQAGATPTQSLKSASSGLKEAYRARRSGIGALLGAVAVVVEILFLVKVLIDAVTAHPTNTGGVLAGVFGMAGVPLVAIGLYGLATGAATAGGPNVGRAWLRTPLAYLPVGLVLIIAAGLAA
jgi:hypothetical protein